MGFLINVLTLCPRDASLRARLRRHRHCEAGGNYYVLLVVDKLSVHPCLDLPEWPSVCLL